MQRTLVVAAAVAALILAGGAGLWLGRSSVSPGGGGSPTPVVATPSPAPTASPAAIPSALQYRWIGASRSIPLLGTSTRTALNFTATTFNLTGTEYGYGGELVSSAGLLGTDRLQFTSTVAASGCQTGDVGTYPWSLTAGGTVLTVQAGIDACTTRAAVMPGTWYRMACKATTDGCFGNLEGLTMRVGQRVRWYVFAQGSESDLHTPHWHGNTVTMMGMRTDVVSLLPMGMIVADMVPDDPGRWLYHCHVNDHLIAGMSAIYTVDP